MENTSPKIRYENASNYIRNYIPRFFDYTYSIPLYPIISHYIGEDPKDPKDPEELMSRVNCNDYVQSSISFYGYTHFDGRTLKNKYGMQGKALQERCAYDLLQAMLNLRKEPLPEKFDSSYLKYLHQRLYEKMFEWAGCTCDTPFTFSDGTVTEVPINNKIKEGLKRIDQILAEKNNFQGLSRKEFIHEVSTVFILLNKIRPFMVGNKYVQRIFFEQIAEAAGHKLDFSVVTEKRMQFAIHAALSFDGNNNRGNITPMLHLFEDISNPEKVGILKEFMIYIRETDVITPEQMRNKIIVIPDEGSTYTGIYKGCSLDSIMLMVKDSYVLCKKDYFSPITVKTLQLDDKLTFRALMPDNFKNILIPGEELPSLTEKEIVARIVKNASVQKCRKEIERLSGLVYGNSRMVNEYMYLINTDSSLGEHHVRNVMNFPQATSKFAGIKILGMKSQKYKQAEAKAFDLSQKIDDYISIVISTRENILQEHQSAQERCKKVLEMPSQALRDILNLPKEDRITTLNANPSLHKELEDFMSKIKIRFSPNEHNAIGKNRYEQLAQSVGISVSKAREITQMIKQSQEACMQVKAFRVSDTRVKTAAFAV
ncbi:MAG: hypothetical protein PG977_000848 [Bartonella clarridgeiae]|uniref:BID domain-containing T4SS effector n=1 Tax=Bartonella clarridgeiae TaxID=56426 RepID=UPI0023F5636D|nr:BID domain-containing T4SS effector [Bartonella clarridgeiae]WCR55455.1 MAG: hypothetical protein PG977_000848 [Bartonella clarridgeiae]